MADVFVSYARSDKERVAPLVAVIEAQGWSVWWDPAIAPGQEFDLQIAGELKIATAVLVVWTANSVGSVSYTHLLRPFRHQTFELHGGSKGVVPASSW